MVDSYCKNLTKEISVTEAAKCESCEGSEVSNKCETCDLLLCEKCEASHTSIASNVVSHTTRAISAIAGDARTAINKVVKQLKTQEEILAAKLANRQKELDTVRQMSENAMKSIGEKEEYLMAKIKIHHDNLRKEVEQEKTKYVTKSRKEYINAEICYHDVKDKQLLLNSWANNRSCLSIANTIEQIQKKLKDIEKESNKNQQHDTLVENFTIKVLEGNGYDTKLIFSTNQSVDGIESEGGAVNIDSKSEEASIVSYSNFTRAEHRDYKAEKTVVITGLLCEKVVHNIQRYNNHLYCMALEKIYVYTEDLEPVKKITLKNDVYVNCRAFICVDDKYLITASNDMQNGLRIVDTDGKDIQRICTGQFYGLAEHNHQLYAYEYNINKVLVFEQRGEYFWKQSGEVYLNYNGNNEHEAKTIKSFEMKNEQIYIADDTSIYHLDMKGNLKRKHSIGIDQIQFKNPRICSVDSKGNLLVAEPGKKKLTVVRADGKCGEVLLRGGASQNIYSAFIGQDNNCVWVADYSSNTSFVVKYTK